MFASSSSATITRRILVNGNSTTTIRRRVADDIGSSFPFARQSSRLYHHGNLSMFQRRPIIFCIDLNNYEKNNNNNNKNDTVMASLSSPKLSFVKLVPEDQLQYRMFSSTTTTNISFSKEERKNDNSQDNTDNDNNNRSTEHDIYLESS